MSTKAMCVTSVGCFILGVALGGGLAMAYFGTVGARGVAMMMEFHIQKSASEAFEAYQDESTPVAIYALSRHLETLNETEELAREAPMVSKLQLILVHGRLAKLYRESGQDELASSHTTAAIRYAEETDYFPQVSDQDELMEIVSTFDQKGIY